MNARCRQFFYQCIPTCILLKLITFTSYITLPSQLYFRMFESKTLESKIEESNVGHQMLKKMGTQHYHVFEAKFCLFLNFVAFLHAFIHYECLFCIFMTSVFIFERLGRQRIGQRGERYSRAN